MAKAFNTLRSMQFGLLDKLPFGKLKGCRICDVIKEDYDYLIWLEQKGFIRYNNDLAIKLEDLALAKFKRRFHKEEVQPYLNDKDWGFYEGFDDIPF